MIFVFVLFAIMGLQQYNGESYNTCRYEPKPNFALEEWASDLSASRPCTINGLGNFQCPVDETCGNIETYPSLSLESERYDERLYLGYAVTTFDNLGTSLLTVFAMITSETWYQQLMNMMDVDFPILGAIYCFAIIIVG